VKLNKVALVKKKMKQNTVEIVAWDIKKVIFSLHSTWVPTADQINSINPIPKFPD